jgi:hypothetical protein
LALVAVLLVTVCVACPVAGQETPATSSDALVLRDAAVFLLDVRGEKLSDQTLFRSTLPPFVLRPRAPAEGEGKYGPSPLGLITLEGGFEQEMDVLLEFPQGRLLSHWPPSKTGLHRTLWQDLLAQPSAEPSSELPEGHWLSLLREAPRLWLSHNRKTDRFLLYDVEVEYKSPLAISLEPEGYRVENTGNWPVHDLTIFKPAGEDRWQVASAAELGPAGEPPPGPKPRVPGTSLLRPRPRGEPADVESLFEDGPGEEPERAGGEEPSETEAEQAPAPKSAVLPIETVEGADPEAPFAVLRTRLAALGLGPPEAGHVASIVQHEVRSRHHATVVYRLDEAQLDRMLPLEITPPPDRRVRVALVVLINADPELSSVIDRLIAELGDADWKTREAAQARLRELGTAAKDKLEAAKENKDVEIAYRAERLLEALEEPPEIVVSEQMGGGFF